jgi:serine/threonine protein kinase
MPESFHQQFAPGFRLGDYEVVCHLGSGSFGDVYKAIRIVDRLFVSLKVCRTENPEAQVLRQLQHRAIVSVIDEFATEHGHVTVMSFVDGVALAALLAVTNHQSRRRLRVCNVLSLLNDDDASAEFPKIAATRPWAKDRFDRFGCRVVREISAAPKHAHARQIFHGDVKPENILIDQDGTAILIDWGTAAAATTAVGVQGGTLNYLTTESLEEIARVQPSGKTESPGPNQANDIFALGIILYEFLTGRLPFPASSADASIVAAARESLAHRSPLPAKVIDTKEIPSGLRNIIFACLNQAAGTGSRYKSVTELFEDLRSYHGVRPLKHAGETWASTSARWWTRYRVWLLGGAVSFLLIVVGFFVDRSLTARHLARASEFRQRILSDGIGDGVLPPEITSAMFDSGVFPDSRALRIQRVNAAHGLAAMYLNCDAAEPAASLLARAVWLDPVNGSLWNDLGIALFQLDDYDAALAALREAMELDCDHAAVLRNRGAVHAALDDPVAARDDFLEALRIDPGHPAALHHLELLESVLGEIVQ